MLDAFSEDESIRVGCGAGQDEPRDQAGAGRGLRRGVQVHVRNGGGGAAPEDVRLLLVHLHRPRRWHSLHLQPQVLILQRPPAGL